MGHAKKGMSLVTSAYLAARFDARAHLLQRVVRPLMSAGHYVTSNWMSAGPNAPVLGQADLTHNLSLGTDHAQGCLDDIDRAEALVVFTDWPSTTGGYHVEFGYARGRGKPIHVVGPPLNVFHAIKEVTFHSNIESFLKAWGCTPA